MPKKCHEDLFTYFETLYSPVPNKVGGSNNIRGGGGGAELEI